MKIRCALITGSCGLIGSEVSQYFSRLGFRGAGIDNNQRAVIFFLPETQVGFWSAFTLRSRTISTTELSLSEVMTETGFTLEEQIPRFLPYTSHGADSRRSGCYGYI